MMSEIKLPVRVSEKSPIVALDATDRPVLWSQWRDDLTTAVTALNSAAELRERIAYLERSEEMNGVFCYQLDRIREHFDEDNRIKGDGKWRIDELVKCLMAMDAAYKKCVQGDDAALKGPTDANRS